jgi:hypothetical protein
MQKLGWEFGISDVGLAKLCRRYEIPVPGRGYWTGIQFWPEATGIFGLKLVSKAGFRRFRELEGQLNHRDLGFDRQIHNPRVVSEIP